MKKYLKMIVLCSLCSLLNIVVGCGNNNPIDKPKVGNGNFVLTLDIPEFSVDVNETIIITAKIKSISNKDVEIEDNGNPIYIGVIPVEEDDGTYIDTALGRTYMFKSNEEIAKFYEFRPDAKGEYVVVVFTKFSVDKENISIIADKKFIIVN